MLNHTKIHGNPWLEKFGGSQIVGKKIADINQNVRWQKIVCDWRESNPRPLVHKTSALPIELQSLRLAFITNYKIKNLLLLTSL